MGVRRDGSCANAPGVASMLMVAHRAKNASGGRTSLRKGVNICTLLFGRPARNCCMFAVRSLVSVLRQVLRAAKKEVRQIPRLYRRGADRVSANARSSVGLFTSRGCPNRPARVSVPRHNRGRHLTLLGTTEIRRASFRPGKAISSALGFSEGGKILGISVSSAQKTTPCQRNPMSAGCGDHGEVRLLGQTRRKRAPF
jgi:hypothetical protein